MIHVGIFVRQMYPVIAGHREGFGGAEIEMYNVSVALARQPGVRVSVATLVEDGTREPFEHRGLRVVPVPYVRINIPGNGAVRRAWLRGAHGLRVMRILMGMRCDCYVTKLASYEFPFIRLATRAIRRPLVYRFASDLETTEESLADKIFGGRPYWARKFISTLGRCDAIMAQTAVQQELIRANYGLSSAVIGNAHEMPSNPAGRDSRDLVLWVGRCHPWKRADLFLDMAAANPDLSFAMIAPGLKGFEGLFEEIRSRAAALPNVEFSAGVAPAEMPAWYERARVFVMTSEVEGFPNVMIEALKHGVPVVSLHLNPDNVLSGDVSAASPGYFFHAAGPEANDCVRMLHDDAAAWHRSSALARSLALERFSADGVAARYLDLIRPLVSGSHS